MKAQLFAQLFARWQAFSPRDQRVLSTLTGVMGLLAVITLAVTPALHTLRDSDLRRSQLAQQQAHMLALQAQAQTLQTRRRLSRDDALRQLQSITPNARLQLQVQGNRVAVQLKAMPAAELAQWLAQARHQAQALPIEAHLTRNAASTSGTLWDGNLVFNLPLQAVAP